jgi:hypothetical protein
MIVAPWEGAMRFSIALVALIVAAATTAEAQDTQSANTIMRGCPDGDARFWSAHGTSTNPFEEGRKYRKTTFPSARGLWRISQRLIELGLSAKKTGAKVKT